MFFHHIVDLAGSPTFWKVHGYATEEVKKIFLMKDKGHSDNPNTFDKVMSDIDSMKWLDAMKLEIDSMHSNQVWTLVDLPEAIVPIGCK